MTTPKRNNEEVVGEFDRLFPTYTELLQRRTLGEPQTLYTSDWLRTILKEKDAEVKRALEVKVIEVREEESDKYNRIIEREVEKVRKGEYIKGFEDGIKAAQGLHS